jgi:FkbM family methyltransferase
VPIRGPGRILLALLSEDAGTIPYAGGRILVSPENPAELSVFAWGTYEPDVEAAIGRFLAPADIAVDVGANCGVLTVAMAAAVAPQGRVVAVDPSPDACARIGSQLRLNGVQGATVVQAALGTQHGQDRYRTAAVGIGALPEVDAAYTEQREVEVEIVTLDSLVADVSPSLVKIDTDGHEVEVLRGAASLLSTARPMLVLEVFAAGLARRGRTLADLSEILDGEGYGLLVPRFKAAARWTPRPRALAGFDAATPSDLAAGKVPDGNIIALHPEVARHASLRRALL